MFKCTAISILFRWYEFLAIKEDVLLRIMDIVDEAGTSFAFPSRTVYQQPSVPHDTEMQKVKERDVEALREQGELPFPDFSAKQYEEFRGTINYPPKVLYPPQEDQ